MAIKFLSARRIFLIILFLFHVFHLGAQEVVYFQETRLSQRLVWSGDPNALQYEVLIERDENGAYRNLISEITTNLFIEVSLFPGLYRFAVVPFDLLGRRSTGAIEWTGFEVLPALRPEPVSFSPVSFAIDPEAQLILSIHGRNLVQGAEISLRFLDRDADPIIPLGSEFLNDGREVRLVFNSSQLRDGVYEIRIRNPGGLESGIRIFTITGEPLPAAPHVQVPINQTPEPVVVRQVERQAERPIDFYLGAGWMPVAILYGETNMLFGENFLTSGAQIRFGGISQKPGFFDYGMEASLSWYALTSPSDNETRPGSSLIQFSLIYIKAQSLVAEYNFLMQRQLDNHNMAFTFRGGLGLAMPIYYSLERQHEPDRYAPYVNLGASFIFSPYRNLFFEGGLNLSQSFLVNHPAGFLRPWIGLGLMF